MKQWTDENGKWREDDGITVLIEPSEKWLEENQLVEPPAPEPSPIEKELAAVKNQNNLLQLQNDSLVERADFLEEVLAELVMVVYN